MDRGWEIESLNSFLLGFTMGHWKAYPDADAISIWNLDTNREVLRLSWDISLRDARLAVHTFWEKR